MILWLTMALLIIVAIGWISIKDNWRFMGSGLDLFLITTLILLGIALVTMVMLAADSRVGFPATVLEIEEIKRTIEQARLDEFGDIERATLQTEILRVNRWIVRAKYWQQNKWTYIFFHPGVTELEPLR